MKKITKDVSLAVYSRVSIRTAVISYLCRKAELDAIQIRKDLHKHADLKISKIITTIWRGGSIYSPQITTNHRKSPQITTNQPQITTNQPQITTNQPQITTNLPQITANHHKSIQICHILLFDLIFE